MFSGTLYTGTKGADDVTHFEKRGAVQCSFATWRSNGFREPFSTTTAGGAHSSKDVGIHGLADTTEPAAATSHLLVVQDMRTRAVLEQMVAADERAVRLERASRALLWQSEQKCHALHFECGAEFDMLERTVLGLQQLLRLQLTVGSVECVLAQQRLLARATDTPSKTRASGSASDASRDVSSDEDTAEIIIGRVRANRGSKNGRRGRGTARSKAKPKIRAKDKAKLKAKAKNAAKSRGTARTRVPPSLLFTKVLRALGAVPSREMHWAARCVDSSSSNRAQSPSCSQPQPQSTVLRPLCHVRREQARAFNATLTNVCCTPMSAPTPAPVATVTVVPALSPTSAAAPASASAECTSASSADLEVVVDSVAQTETHADSVIHTQAHAQARSRGHANDRAPTHTHACRCCHHRRQRAVLCANGCAEHSVCDQCLALHFRVPFEAILDGLVVWACPWCWGKDQSGKCFDAVTKLTACGPSGDDLAVPQNGSHTGLDDAVPKIAAAMACADGVAGTVTSADVNTDVDSGTACKARESPTSETKPALMAGDTTAGAQNPVASRTGGMGDVVEVLSSDQSDWEARALMRASGSNALQPLLPLDSDTGIELRATLIRSHEHFNQACAQVWERNIALDTFYAPAAAAIPVTATAASESTTVAASKRALHPTPGVSTPTSGAASHRALVLSPALNAPPASNLANDLDGPAPTTAVWQRRHCDICSLQERCERASGARSAREERRLYVHPWVPWKGDGSAALVCEDCVRKVVELRASAEAAHELLLPGEQTEELCACCAKGGTARASLSLACCRLCQRAYCQSCLQRLLSSRQLAAMQRDDEWCCPVCIAPTARLSPSSTKSVLGTLSSSPSGTSSTKPSWIACALRIGLLDETDVGAADAEQALQARERGAVRRQAKRRRLEQQAHVAKLPPVNKQRDAADYFAGYAGPESSAKRVAELAQGETEDTCFCCKDGGELIECDWNRHRPGACCPKVYHAGASPLRQFEKPRLEAVVIESVFLAPYLPIALPLFNFCLCCLSRFSPLECLGFEVPDNTEWLCPRHFCRECGYQRPRYTCKYCPMSFCQQHLPQDCEPLGAAGDDMPSVALVCCPWCQKLETKARARGYMIV